MSDLDAFLDRLEYRRDVRKAPDGRRRGQFRRGWREAVEGRTRGTSLDELTWNNLGFRAGREFGAGRDVDATFEELARRFRPRA